MNVIEATRQTMDVANNHKLSFPKEGPLSYSHLIDMWERMLGEEMSIPKLNRWLGWMQCAVVATGVASLEDMKNINKACKDD